MKKSADEAVDRVLAGLRSVERPEGMEQRIAAVLHEREAEHARRAVRAWVWAAAAVLLAVVALPSRLWLRHQGVTMARHPIPVRQMPQPVRVPQQQVAVEAERKGSRPRLVEAAPGGVEGVKKRVQVPRSMRINDQIALREMHAPSKPVPPEPLTAQERRLQQIAQRGIPEELAALNPEERTARYESEKAAVMNFFEPAKVESNE